MASSPFLAEPPVQAERSQIAAAARLPRVLDYVGAAPVFGDANNREALRTSMSYGQFIDWLAVINGIATNTPTAFRGFSETAMCLEKFSHDGTDGPIVYLAPDPELRDELLQQTWEGVQKMDGRLPAVGRLLATTIFLIQPFLHGNKRTARIVDLLVREGYDGSESSANALVAAVANNEPRADVAFSELGEALAADYADLLTDEYVGTGADAVEIKGITAIPAIVNAPGLDDNEKESLADLLREPDFNIPLVLGWANHTGRDISDFADNGVIDVKKVLRACTVDDYRAMLWCNDLHKSGFILSIVRAFADNETIVYGDIMEFTDAFWPKQAVRQVPQQRVPSMA